MPVPLETDGLVAHYELDGSFSDISGRYQHGRTVVDPTFDPGQIGRAATFDGDTEVSFGNIGGAPGAARRSAWRCGSGTRQHADGGAAEARRKASWLRARVRGPGAVRHPAMGGPLDDVVADAPSGGIRVRTRERLHYGDWYHVAVTSDGLGKAAGVKVFVNGSPIHIVEIASSDPLPSTRR